MHVQFIILYVLMLTATVLWSWEVSQFRRTVIDDGSVACGTSPPNKTMNNVEARVHCISACRPNQGCSSPCQAKVHCISACNQGCSSPCQASVHCISACNQGCSSPSLVRVHCISACSPGCSSPCQAWVHCISACNQGCSSPYQAMVHCISACNQGCSSPCQAVNYWQTSKLCQLFHYQPCFCDVLQGCENYQVSTDNFLESKILILLM